MSKKVISPLTAKADEADGLNFTNAKTQVYKTPFEDGS